MKLLASGYTKRADQAFNYIYHSDWFNSTMVYMYNYCDHWSLVTNFKPCQCRQCTPVAQWLYRCMSTRDKVITTESTTVSPHWD